MKRNQILFFNFVIVVGDGDGRYWFRRLICLFVYLFMVVIMGGGGGGVAVVGVIN